MADDSGLTIDFAPSGRNGTGTLTARLADEMLHVEHANVTKSKARTEFAKVLCDGRSGLDKAAIEAELLRLAGDVASKPDGEAPDPATLPEIDASRIIRPERFIGPEVSGLAVPTMTTAGDKVRGRWQVYLRWADGRRERRALGTVLDLPDGGRLWVHPEPSEPTPTMRPGWSASARKRWLDGEAAPEPAKVFKRVCERVAYFLDLPQRHAPGVTATLALWVILTYCYLAWSALPYLYCGGPTGSGKSRVFEILVRLVWRPFATSNPSAASLFRTLHANGGTLLLDEAEQLKNTRDPNAGEIGSTLLAGYKAGGSATRTEPVGESGFRPVSFDVYGPKALACIAGLPPALASRAIPITMFRAAPGSDKPRRRIDAAPARWQALRDELHALALEHGPTFLELADRADVCPPMSGRDYELWQPLLSLASWIEAAGARGLLTLLSEHALSTAEAGRDDQTPDFDETLLRLLAEAVRFGERPEPGELLKKAQEAEPTAFKTWTARAVTAHLKRYGIPTPKKSMGRRVFRDVTIDHLRQIQESYGIDLDLPEAATVPPENEAAE